MEQCEQFNERKERNTANFVHVPTTKMIKARNVFSVFESIEFAPGGTGNFTRPTNAVRKHVVVVGIVIVQMQRILGNDTRAAR